VKCRENATTINRKGKHTKVIRTLGSEEELERRKVEIEREWVEVRERIGDIGTLLELSCSATTFYEVLLNEYKNRLVAFQASINKEEQYMRVWLVKKVENFTRLFGKEANVTKQCVEELTEYDSVRGREETDKYVRYLIENNEKPTRDFCSLGKSKSTVHDIKQIQKTGGGNFESDKESSEHIRLFYSNLY